MNVSKLPPQNPAKTPPKGMSDEAKAWWRRLVKEYSIEDDAGLFLLETGLEAFQRMRNCQIIIKQDGEIVLDRFGQKKSHPLLPAERDARSQMLASLKALNLDIEPQGGG